MNKKALICHLENSGKAKAVKTIAPAMNVSEAEVRKAAAEINSDGVFSVKTGQGGGLTLRSLLEKEVSVYPLIEKHLADWIKSAIYSDKGTTEKRLKCTHKNKLSGKWSTPDFSLICVHKFLHLSQKAVEIVTVEVKHAKIQFDVSCVYEALAHTRVSSYGILFFYKPISLKLDDSVLGEIKSECARLGLGLVISDYPSSVADWTLLIPAKKQAPDMQRVDLFIDEAFDEDEKKWLKTHL
jgi:hypothetical protein